MGQPAGRHGPARNLVVPGVRREVKHLSTCRKGYSVSSGERKRIRPNHGRVIPVGGLRSWCCGSVCPGSDGPGGSHKTACQGNRLEGLAAEGASPVPGSLPSSDHVSQVARASWNPV